MSENKRKFLDGTRILIPSKSSLLEQRSAILILSTTSPTYLVKKGRCINIMPLTKSKATVSCAESTHAKLGRCYGSACTPKVSKRAASISPFENFMAHVAPLRAHFKGPS